MDSDNEALQPVPFADSYWVIPGRLLAGEYPGAIEERNARKKLLSLLQSGINAALDLTEEGELMSYQEFWREEAAECGLEVLYRRMPIRDFSTPTEQTVVNILDQIDTWLAKGRNIYLHCWGGIGRTGTLVGCYLVRHGMAPDKALTRLAELRKAVPDRWRRSPETDGQVEKVLSWRPGK